ncbi:uncharacterized protein DNG_01987 [Cephalotrichum gorgonifer]|uniref:Uncharacterized protein n=1 Tax=Cephalotrichum gorgonifer TaxID=2041049 RepID=A0AAE8MRS4_9PEZI|nr:uncharacterized protein DNG_01987 [Cephalotrichum gorgonifer]
MAAIPIALYGVQVEISRKVQEALLPEYDVVHVVLTRQAAEEELPALLSGNTSITPSSGVGSNVERPVPERLIPRVLAFSTGVSDADLEAAVKATGIAAGAYTRPDASEVRAQGAVGQDPGAYARALKIKLSELGFK